MSLFKKVARTVGRVVKKTAPLLPGPVGTIARIGTSIAGAGAMAALPRMLPSVSALPRVLPGVGAAVGRTVAKTRSLGPGGVARMSKKAARAAGYIVTGGLIYDAAGNLIGRAPSRRLNPMNHRALNRAIRRVCAAKKIAKKVEKLTGGGRRKVCAPRGKRC